MMATHMGIGGPFLMLGLGIFTSSTRSQNGVWLG